MKKIIVILLFVISVCSAFAEQHQSLSLKSLKPEIRNRMYPVVNTRDINTEDGKVSPKWAFVALQDNILHMLYDNADYYELSQKQDGAKNYLNHIFTYIDYDLLKEYVQEIEDAYAVMKKNAPKKEIMYIESVFTNTSDEAGLGRFHNMKVTYIERDMPKEAGISSKERSFEKLQQLVRPLNQYQTWKDYFLNGKKDIVLPALKEYHVKEWLTYVVEYELPQKDVPAYRKKLKAFLVKWGL